VEPDPRDDLEASWVDASEAQPEEPPARPKHDQGQPRQAGGEGHPRGEETNQEGISEAWTGSRIRMIRTPNFSPMTTTSPVANGLSLTKTSTG